MLKQQQGYVPDAFYGSSYRARMGLRQLSYAHKLHTQRRLLRLQEIPSRPRVLATRMESVPSSRSNSSLSPAQTVLRHIDGFNQRNLEQILGVLAPECTFEGLVYREFLRGKEELREYYRRMMNNVPRTLKVAVDDITNAKGPSVGVVWHLVLDEYGVPFGRGISFYRLNHEGHISYIRESPEHVTKLPLSALPTLSFAAPFLRVLAPLAPNVVSKSTKAEQNAVADRTMQLRTTDDEPSIVEQQLSTAYSELEALRKQVAQLESEKSRLTQELEQRSKASVSSSPSSTTPIPSSFKSVAESNGTKSTKLPLVQATSDASPQQTVEPPRSKQVLNVSGVWVKDEVASDMEGYDKALSLMRLNNLQKMAAYKLFEGVEITQTADILSLRFLTIVPFFQVTETYNINGQSKMARRDLKKGMQTAVTTAFEDRVEVNISWGEPNRGTVKEVYTMPKEGVLHLFSTVSAGASTASTTQVYNRADSWTPKNEMKPSAFGLRSYPTNPFS